MYLSLCPYMHLDQKRDDVRRLKNARSRLMDDQLEVHQRINVLLRPELPVIAWRGERAEAFQSFRTGPFISSYENISITQINDVLGRINSEIMAIEGAISSLQGEIASTESSISDLRERKREELRDSK